MAGRVRDQQGFTLIELMVAVSVLAVGILGLVGSLEGGRSLNTVAENLTAMTHVAQREVESLHDTPYAAIAHASAPTRPASPAPTATNPAFYICAPGQYNWDWSWSGAGGCPANSGELVVKDPGSNIPGIATQRSWFDARTNARGLIHTYITWVNDPNCSASGCSTARDYKRLTVAVTLTNGKPRRPVVVSSFAYDDSGGRICSDPELRNGSNQPLGTNCG